MRKGFTLTELLLGAVVLAFGLTGLLALFMNCIFLNESSRNLAVAISHAEYIMEEVKNTDFNSIKTKSDNGDWDWNSAMIVSQGLTATALESEYIDTNTTGTDLLDVRVTVAWKDRSSRDRNTALETLITEQP